MKHRNSIVSGVVVLLVCTGSSGLIAQAMPSTMNFTGQIPAEPLFGTSTTTATVTGLYIFETATPDSSADPAIGIYLGAITALSFTVNGKNGAHPGFSRQAGSNEVASGRVPRQWPKYTLWIATSPAKYLQRKV